jgi:hypothetical protein
MVENIKKKVFAIVVIVFMIINLILIGIGIAIWIGSIQSNLISGTDFGYFYTAFSIVKSEDAAKLYDLNVQAQYQREILGLSPDYNFFPFLYPPFVALFMSILTELSLNTAYYIWSLCQLGLLIWLILLLNRNFSDWNKKERLLLDLTILAFWPLSITLLLGQFSLVILFCLVQMYLAMKDSKMFKAGFWLALLMIKPQTILFPGLITVNKRYWRMAVVSFIIFLSLVLFSSIFLSFRPWIDYARLLPAMSNYYGEYGFTPNVEYTLKGMLVSILGIAQGNLVSTISIIALVVGMILVMLLWLPGITANQPKFKLMFAFMVTMSVFLNLHSYPHDSLILILPAVILYDYLRQMGFPRRGFSILVLSSPLIFFITAFTHIGLFSILRPPVIVILVLLAWMIKYMIQDFRTNRSNMSTTIKSINPT